MALVIDLRCPFGLPVLIPLIAILAIAIASRFAATAPRHVRRIAALFALAQCGAAIAQAPRVSTPLSGAMIALVSLATVLASFSVKRRVALYFSLNFAIAAGAIGCVSAQHMGWWFLFAAVTLASLAAFVAIGGERRLTSLRTLNGLFALSLFLIAASLLFLHARAPSSWRANDWANIDFLSEAPIFGSIRAVQIAYVALVVAVIVLLFAPALRSIERALAAAPAPAAMLFFGILPMIAIGAIERVGLLALPELSRWGAPGLAIFGAMAALLFAWRALGEVDLKRFAISVSMAHGSVLLVALGSGTSVGVVGAIAGAPIYGAVAALLFAAIGMIERRSGQARADKLGGLMIETPRYGAAIATIFLASAGAPLFAPFWSALLTILGAIPNTPGSALLVSLALGVLALAHARIFAHAFFGKLADSWRRSPILEPLGGRFRDMTWREFFTLAPIVIVCVAAGIAPWWWLDPVSVAVRALGSSLGR